jgi:hypothetical protein
MEASSSKDAAHGRSVRLVAISAVVSAIGFPSAATFSVPTAVGYVALPGVMIFTLMAVCSVVCFVLCPRLPLIQKVIACGLMVNAVFWFLYCTGYYWLHLVYHA